MSRLAVWAPLALVLVCLLCGVSQAQPVIGGGWRPPGPCTTGQTFVFNGTIWQCGDAGVTNDADENVIPKADADGNLVASSWTDNGTTSTTTGNLKVNGSAGIGIATDANVGLKIAKPTGGSYGLYVSTGGTLLGADGSGTSMLGTLGVTGLSTLTGGFTLGADSSAGSHKITSLSNGTASSDAAAFGQIASAVNAAVSGTSGRSARLTGSNTVGTGAFTDDGTNAIIKGRLTEASSVASDGTLSFTSGGGINYIQSSLDGASGSSGELRFTNGLAAATWAKFDTSGNFTANNNVTVGGTLTSTGLLTATAGVTTPADLTTTGTGDLVSADDLTVGDAATIGGDATINRSAGTSPALFFKQTGQIDWKLYGTASANTFRIWNASTGNVATWSSGNLTLNTTLDTFGATVIHSTLNATGAADFDSTVNVDGDFMGVGGNFSSDLTIDGLTEAVGGFSSLGDTDLGDDDANTISLKGKIDTHVYYTGTAPTLSSCGTSPTITGNDERFVITIGTGSPTDCTVTFADAYTTNAPVCVVSGGKGVGGTAPTLTFSDSYSTTAITIHSPSGMSNGAKIFGHCDGVL